MLFFHLGGTLWLFRWIFRDPRVDVRFLLAGALLPDVLDLPIGSLVLGVGEVWAHSLLVPTAFMATVLLVTRRGRRRRAWMALGVGWLFHLLLDGMWLDQQVFLWPIFGEMTSAGDPFWPAAMARALHDPWRWLKEVVGLGYLVWMWLALGLNDRARRENLMSTGRLPKPRHEDS